MRNPRWMALVVLAFSLGVIGAGSPALAAGRSAAPPAAKVSAATAKAVKTGKAAKAAKAASKAAAPKLAPGAAFPSGEVRRIADWVIASGDNEGMPFVIVDKVGGEVFAFRRDGQLRAAAPALVGLALGDDSTPGVGDRELSDIPPEERTTPAGRFIARFGPDADRRQVFWIDYGSAISLHPVIKGEPAERRRQRLKSPSPDDNRITFGCINVPPAFYDKFIQKAFAGKQAVVYILPDTKPLEEVFPGLVLSQTASREAAAEPQFPSLAGGR